MSENVQAADAVVEEPGYAPANFGEHVIGFLSGLMLGGIAYGIVIAIVAAIHASEPPGWTVEQLVESLKLAPPPGVSLSGIPKIILYPFDNENANIAVSFVLDTIAYVVAFGVTIWGYFKTMSLDGEN